MMFTLGILVGAIVTVVSVWVGCLYFGYKMWNNS